MKHRMYERMLYNTYVKLNYGLDCIHNVQGLGCPSGINPITPEELEQDRRLGATKGYNPEIEPIEEKPSILRFLKKGGEAYRNLYYKEKQY